MNEVNTQFEYEQGSAEIGRIGIVGLGSIGVALVKGLVTSQVLGKNEIFVCNRTKENTLEKVLKVGLAGKIQIAKTNIDLVSDCDVVFLGLKQKQLKEELESWREKEVSLEGKLLVSFAAGVRIATIKKWIGNINQAVARVMPNTPVSVGRGVFGWTVSDEVTVGQAKQLAFLLNRLGVEVFVSSDREIDAVTAISGSGPAYFFRFAESMVEVAVELGIDYERAKKLVKETLIGGATLLDQSERELDSLRLAVTSKGGTTEAAMMAFENNNLNGVVRAGVIAAFDKARELGNYFDSF